MTQTTNLNRTAQDWAWAEFTSPNLSVDKDHALVLLAYARLADEALCTGNGYSYTTVNDVQAVLQDLLSWHEVNEATANLRACGLLVEHRDGYRVPEVAFGN